MSPHDYEVAATASAERSLLRRSEAARRSRRRLRVRGLAAAALVSMLALSGVALAATGAANAPSAHRARAAVGSLGPGDSGPGVAALQRALGIRATGRYDAATRRAVRRCQRENGLAVDGIAGPETLAALGVDVTTVGRRSSAATGSTPTPDAPATAAEAAELRKIAQCESGGDPQQVSSDGKFRGKYQFDRDTWAAVGGHGDPAKAPESVQDQIALKLLHTRGKAPWPSCA